VLGRETVADLNARVAGARDELFAGLLEGRVAVVFTEDAVVRVASAWALDTGPSRHVEVAICSITMVGVVGVGRLVRMNECGARLEGLALEP
jgi:broad specificity phosphatase PhoE